MRTTASRRARVIVTDVNVEKGRAVAEALGDKALFVSLDVGDPQAWQSAIAEGAKAFGPVTVLINNAGIVGEYADTADLSIELFQHIMTVNAFSVFYGMRWVIPGMLGVGGGSIVNISSVAGIAHIPVMPNLAFTGSKFAIRGLTKAAAAEYASRNIRVNSVHPGFVLTPMLANHTTEEEHQSITAGIPLGRMAQPLEVSNLVLFLASDESSFRLGRDHRRWYTAVTSGPNSAFLFAAGIPLKGAANNHLRL